MIYILLNADEQQFRVYPDPSIQIPIATINENLQHQETLCSFSVPFDTELLAFLAANETINACVYEDSIAEFSDQPLFTGIIDTEISWIDNGNPEPVESIPLAIKDNTYLLDRQTADEIAIIDTTLAEVITQICTDCSVTIEAGTVLPTTALEAFVLDKGTSYLTAINNLLFEYCMAFYFNGSGEFAIIDLNAAIENTIELDEESIYTGLKWNRTSKKSKSVKVTYGTITKKENEQVYFEGNALNEQHQVNPIVLRPSQYYPYESDPSVESSSGQVYQSYTNGYAESYELYSGEKRYRRTEKTQLIYTENHTLTQDWDSAIQIDRTQFGARQASVRLINSGSSDANLYQLAIRADAYYRNSDITITLGTGTSFDYQTEYIYNDTDAESFAEMLSRFFVSGNFRITGFIDTECKAGDCFVVDTGVSGVTADALVLSSIWLVEENKYSVELLSFGTVKTVTGRYKVNSSAKYSFQEQNQLLQLTDLSVTGNIGQLGIYQGRFYKFNGTEWMLINAVLPTDSILHYSFDEVPDLPDGVSIVKYNNDFVLTDWSTLRCNLSLDGNKLKATNTSSNTSGIKKSNFTYSNLTGKICKTKIFIHSTGTSGSVDLRIVGNDILTRIVVEKEKWIDISFIIGTGTPSNQYLVVSFDSTSTDN